MTTRKPHRPGTVPGSVYLICASATLGNARHSARHYIGYATTLKHRILSHATNHPDRTPKIIQAMNLRGIGWTVARIWTSEAQPETPEGIAAPLQVDRIEGVTEHFEKQLKRRHNHKDLCPICSAKPQRGGQRCKAN